ncbi:MAG: GTP cyclohydrolase, FolE2/MptA family, partial [Pseudomonadota bacterium]
MNIHVKDIDGPISRQDAEDALAVLKRYAEKTGDDALADLDPTTANIVTYPNLSRVYPERFETNAAYKDTLPDLQNGPSSLIRGANRAIQHVGISNFRLPVPFRMKDGGERLLDTSVTGTVSLDADKKGINMSRIMRSFYGHAERTFSFEVIEAALDDYKSDLESFDARIQMRVSFP